MKVKMSIEAILATPSLTALKDRLFLEGVYANYSESINGLTSFTITQLDQGQLINMLQVPLIDFTDYDFYCELDSSELDIPVHVDFENSTIQDGVDEDDNPVMRQLTLREYHMGYLAEKDGKALLTLDHADHYDPKYKLNDLGRDHNFLVTWCNLYGTPVTLGNIYTSHNAIATKKVEYESVGE